MHFLRKLGITFLLSIAIGASAQMADTDSAARSAAELQKQDQLAQELYQQNNFLGALPLYEDLHTRQPTNNIYREHLAMCQLAKAGGVSPAESAALHASARKLLLEAQASGDDSNLLKILLEKLSDPNEKSNSAAVEKTPAQMILAKAENAFSSGDLTGAMVLYRQAVDADPKLYEAPLFAGDAEFKLKHYDEAGIWFAKAIAIDPDRETAYRYWGDALMRKGDQKEAQSKFIEAILCAPYAKTPWVGLKQWAEFNHAMLVAPAITLPKQPVPDAKGNVNVTIDASTLGSPASGAWLVYSMNPMVWREKEFKKHYPAETTYRHSLAEESDSLHSVLSVVKEQKIAEKKLDPTLKSLVALDKDGMLECWILLNHADNGIAQDYVRYRAEHRQLLHAYMDKYVVHAN